MRGVIIPSEKRRQTLSSIRFGVLLITAAASRDSLFSTLFVAVLVPVSGPLTRTSLDRLWEEVETGVLRVPCTSTDEFYRGTVQLCADDPHDLMTAYDRVVVELNATRLRGTSFPIVHAFIQAALSLKPDVSTVQRCSMTHLIVSGLASSSSRSNIPYPRKNNWRTTWNSATRSRRGAHSEHAATRAPTCSCTPWPPYIKGRRRVEITDCCRGACCS